MLIPRFWVRSETRHVLNGDDTYALSSWGWSDESRDHAREVAAERLTRLVARAEQKLDKRRHYLYADTPLREEIIERFAATESPSHAILTRNSQGCLILNAAALMFIDVDIPPPTPVGLLTRLFSRAERDPAVVTLNTLRIALMSLAPMTFRLYRTAGGYRAIVVDRTFAPDSEEAARIFGDVSADPAYATLCRVQKSFRARLTPKPWRMPHDYAPGRFPRDDGDARAFETWLTDYQKACAAFATCAFLETIGQRQTLPEFAPLIALHDGYSRCETGLPLA
jgi:hypothetical protein